MKDLTHKITRLIIENEKATKTLTELDRRLDRRFSLDQEVETENEDIINRLPLATEQHILEMEHFLLEKKNEKKLVSLNIINVKRNRKIYHYVKNRNKIVKNY